MRVISIPAADMNYRHTLGLAGTVCEITTNSSHLGNTLRTWRKEAKLACAGTFTMQVVVSDGARDRSKQPHFRGLHHIVIASFGPSNVFVFDILRRNVVATISEDTATDPTFWNELLLPMAMGVLGASVGVVPVHCACLAVGEEGLLVAGASGAGKSTLSAALAQCGLDFISDDWTYLSGERGTLVAHGMATPVKLLPDAIRYFPPLADYPVRLALNGELAYEVPADTFGAAVRPSCIPRWFVFLERTAVEGCQFNPISAEEASRYIEAGVEPLPSQLRTVQEARAAIIQQVSRLSCWTFRYGGPPHIAIGGFQKFLSHERQEVRA